MENPITQKLIDMARAARQRMDAEESNALWTAAFAIGGYQRMHKYVLRTGAASEVYSALELDEIYAQLADEATELAHAALKMRRVINRKNPTPVDADDAFESVLEEANDVLAVLDVLHIPRDDWRVCQKLKRWEERLQNGNQELHDGD